MQRSAPISSRRWSVSSQPRLRSGEFIWPIADSCAGEAFRLISCPHAVGERKTEEAEEGVAKCWSAPSKDPLLPLAHSLSSLTRPSFRLRFRSLSPSLPLVTDSQVLPLLSPAAGRAAETLESPPPTETRERERCDDQ